MEDKDPTEEVGVTVGPDVKGLHETDTPPKPVMEDILGDLAKAQDIPLVREEDILDREEGLPEPDPELAEAIQWFYGLSDEERLKAIASIREAKLPGRNEPCPCGSEKKFKKCCLDDYQASARLAGRKV